MNKTASNAKKRKNGKETGKFSFCQQSKRLTVYVFFLVINSQSEPKQKKKESKEKGCGAKGCKSKKKHIYIYNKLLHHCICQIMPLLHFKFACRLSPELGDSFHVFGQSKAENASIKKLE